ncbi:GNAT family N-acetyltransferase [Streptomyces sp. NBC_01478]|jgi:hypothetical protein|uniref:GNAT family N-acetyltransferase n=1 Tax=Streptomyces sp. NBC_01478 TaxID=2903882 RepID=UPI002E31E755|nr:GNAT family N-acetyltransferase [Streptomyces sp. NBC_01478]
MHHPEIQRFTKIEEVPESVWRDLSEPSCLFTTRDWSLTLRRSNPAVPVEFWAARDSAGWLLGIPVHIYPEAPGRSTYDVWSLHRHDLRPPADSLHRSRPHVLIGTRNGQRNGFLRAARRPDPELAGRLLRAIADEHRTSVVGMLYLDRPLLDAVRGQLADWHAGFVDAAAELRVPDGGTGVESFADTVSDSRTRGRIRAELRTIAGEEPAVRIDSASEIHALAPTLAPLLVRLNRRHGQPSDEASMTAYIRATADSGLRPRLFVTGSLTEPRAFSLGVRDNRLMSVRVVGLDEDRLGNRATDYPRVLVYEPLAYAGRAGVRAVDLGVGALYAKMLRGARAVPLYSLVRLPEDLGVTIAAGGEKLRLADLRAGSPKLSEETLLGWAVDHG